MLKPTILSSSLVNVVIDMRATHLESGLLLRLLGLDISENPMRRKGLIDRD